LLTPTKAERKKGFFNSPAVPLSLTLISQVPIEQQTGVKLLFLIMRIKIM
jgi:hypothetical protein